MPQRREQVHARILRKRGAARHELDRHVVEQLAHQLVALRSGHAGSPRVVEQDAMEPLDEPLERRGLAATHRHDDVVVLRWPHDVLHVRTTARDHRHR